MKGNMGKFKAQRRDPREMAPPAPGTTPVPGASTEGAADYESSLARACHSHPPPTCRQPGGWPGSQSSLACCRPCRLGPGLPARRRCWNLAAVPQRRQGTGRTGLRRCCPACYHRCRAGLPGLRANKGRMGGWQGGRLPRGGEPLWWPPFEMPSRAQPCAPIGLSTDGVGQDRGPLGPFGSGVITEGVLPALSSPVLPPCCLTRKLTSYALPATPQVL